MPLATVCSAMFSPGGDKRTIVPRGPHNPITFPEANVIRAMHGPESLDDVKIIGAIETDPVVEKQRLQLLYGSATVEAVYPGVAPQMVMLAPGHEPEGPIDPVTGQAPVTVSDADVENAQSGEDTEPPSPFAETTRGRRTKS